MSAKNELKKLVKKEEIYLVKQQFREQDSSTYGIALDKPSRYGSRAVLFEHNVNIMSTPNEAGYDIRFSSVHELSLKLDHCSYLKPASIDQIINDLRGDITPIYTAIDLLKDDKAWNKLIKSLAKKVKKILKDNNATLVKRNIDEIYIEYGDWEPVNLGFALYVAVDFKKSSKKKEVLVWGIFPFGIGFAEMVPRSELEPINPDKLDPLIWMVDRHALGQLEIGVTARAPTQPWCGET